MLLNSLNWIWTVNTPKCVLLDAIARINLEKLAARTKKRTLQGYGDNR